jgi:CRISP-associated protein Cas1
MTVLFLRQFGCSLGVMGENFKITYIDRPPSYAPAQNISGIVIESKINLSHAALDLVQKHLIPVYWVGYRNNPMMLVPFHEPGTIKLRRAQYKAINKKKGHKIAILVITNNLNNKISVLRRISRNNENLTEDLKPHIEDISKYSGHELISNLKNISTSLTTEARDKLLGFEATFTKCYYEGVRAVLQKYNWSFDKRSRRPAQDPYNALLNYGYAILQSQIWYIVQVSGLDTHAGFFHSDKNNRLSLVLDIIEIFRPIIDEIVLRMIIEGKIKEEDFFEIDETKSQSTQIMEIFKDESSKDESSKDESSKDESSKDESDKISDDSEELNIKLKVESKSNSSNGVIIPDDVKTLYITEIFTTFSRRIRKKSLYQWKMVTVQSLCKILLGESNKYNSLVLKVKDPW